MVAVKRTQNNGFRKNSKSEVLGLGGLIGGTRDVMHSSPEPVKIKTAIAHPIKVAL